jgi:hypothetical protein
MENSIKQIEKMQSVVARLTKEMDVIFKEHGAGLEAPEFMETKHYDKWIEIHQLQRAVFIHMEKVERACDDFAKFAFHHLN